MDVIRCDEPTYLVWKWRPHGQDANSTKKENVIRYGSSLRVKQGEVAVFVYPQDDGTKMDFIEGAYDGTIKTANFPVLSSIVGLAFGGASPFQAEIYFINCAHIIQTQFGVPLFDVFDPRFLDFGVPVTVHGTLTFKIADYKQFIDLHRLIDFDLEQFRTQIRDAVIGYAKEIVIALPKETNIPVVQLESQIATVRDRLQEKVQSALKNDFGVIVTRTDISALTIDKESAGYQKLMAVTQEMTTQTVQAQTAQDIKNREEMLRIQREESQRAQQLHTEGANLAAHRIDQQAAVGVAAANALGQMPAGSLGETGFNPAALMTGMAVGSALGQNMAGMMQGVLQQNTMPPPIMQYHIAQNGQDAGAFDMLALQQMAASGQITKDTLVWKNGMANWAAASTVTELAPLFATNAPPVPPVPPIPQ